VQERWDAPRVWGTLARAAHMRSSSGLNSSCTFTTFCRFASSGAASAMISRGGESLFARTRVLKERK
jgi:hypothetical protein